MLLWALRQYQSAEQTHIVLQSGSMIGNPDQTPSAHLTRSPHPVDIKDLLQAHISRADHRALDASSTIITASVHTEGERDITPSQPICEAKQDCVQHKRVNLNA